MQNEKLLVCYFDKLNFKSFQHLPNDSFKIQSLKELKVTLNQEDYMVKNSFESCLSALTNLHLKKIVNFTGEENHTNCEVMIFGL